VGVFVWYRGVDNNLHTLLQYPEGDQMACLLKGRIKSAGKNTYKDKDYLVFANEFADQFAEAVGRLNSNKIHTSIRTNLVAFASSDTERDILRHPCIIGVPYTNGALKIDFKLNSTGDSKTKVLIAGTVAMETPLSQ
jgi:hypothetical protein